MACSRVNVLVLPLQGKKFKSCPSQIATDLKEEGGLDNLTLIIEFALSTKHPQKWTLIFRTTIMMTMMMTLKKIKGNVILKWHIPIVLLNTTDSYNQSTQYYVQYVNNLINVIK
jgi:hypothetical protein